VLYAQQREGEVVALHCCTDDPFVPQSTVLLHSPYDTFAPQEGNVHPAEAGDFQVDVLNARLEYFVESLTCPPPHETTALALLIHFDECTGALDFAVVDTVQFLSFQTHVDSDAAWPLAVFVEGNPRLPSLHVVPTDSLDS
jgi:hypothetical protein